LIVYTAFCPACTVPATAWTLMQSWVGGEDADVLADVLGDAPALVPGETVDVGLPGGEDAPAGRVWHTPDGL
jgi:hypothetical protein